MEGESLLKYLDYNETYQIQYPTVYGRSILSKPWAELGDKGSVKCLETGFRAEITFHTKGSFGSAANLHSVSGKLFNKEDVQFAALKGDHIKIQNLESDRYYWKKKSAKFEHFVPAKLNLR